MTKPLVSVIVPVYNVELYISQCLESIINQTYDNLEIIVVDDGSPDGSTEICRSYAEKDSRIKYIRKENGGLSSARNAGLKAATGKYLVYVDSDDYIRPEMISDMVSLAEENGLYLVKSNFCRCNSKGEELENPPEDGKVEFYTPEQAVDNFLNAPYGFNKAFKVSVWDALYLREAFDGIDFPEGKLYEDGYYTPLVLLKCKKAAHINKSYYVYRINEKSIIGEGFNPKSLKSLDDWEFIHNHVSEAMPQFRLNTARIWAERLVIKYENIIADDTVDADGYYRKIIEKTFSDNFSLFKKACGKSDTIKKIKAIVRTPDKYYEKYILSKVSDDTFTVKLKSLVYFIVSYRTELLKSAVSYIKKFFRTKKRIFLLGTPSYNNIGDHAIALGTRKFIEKYFSDFEYSEYDRLKEPLAEKARQIRIKAEMKKQDIILLVGGGNFGSLYPVEEEYRRKIIGRYKKNKIVFLSSTMHFENTYAGRCELKKSKTVYESHPDITLFLRDERSLEQAEKSFSGIDCFLIPDFANILAGSLEAPSERSGIYICFREDSERLYDDGERENFIEFCKKTAETDVGDNAFSEYVDSSTREEKIREYLKFFSGHSLVVTDRFHGVIFSAITGTPCVALKNNNNKVSDGLMWFKDCGFIRLADDMESAKNAVEELYGSASVGKINFDAYFDKAAEIIKK